MGRTQTTILSTMSTRVSATGIVAKNINSRRSSVVGVGAVVAVAVVAVVVLLRSTARRGRRSSPTGRTSIFPNFTAPLKGVHGS